MITIKLKADNIRLLKAAKTEPELRGVVDLVLERIEQAETMAAFGKKPSPKTAKELSRYNWKVAKEALGSVLGEDLRHPPFPDPIWYQRVHRNMKMYDLTEDKLIALAEYAKKNLKPPYSLDFLIAQYDRILQGAYDRKTWEKTTAKPVNHWRENNQLPED